MEHHPQTPNVRLMCVSTPHYYLRRAIDQSAQSVGACLPVEEHFREAEVDELRVEVLFASGVYLYFDHYVVGLDIPMSNTHFLKILQAED